MGFVSRDMVDDMTVTYSQSYLIGAQRPGDTVIPVRVVSTTDGTVMARCVALRDGAHPCSNEWPLVIAGVVGTDHSLEREVRAMMDHMRRYHAQPKYSKCPTCQSPMPSMHPATSQGEVTKLCEDVWHK